MLLDIWAQGQLHGKYLRLQVRLCRATAAFQEKTTKDDIMLVPDWAHIEEALLAYMALLTDASLKDGRPPRSHYEREFADMFFGLSTV